MKKFLKLTATAVSLVMALALMSCDNGNGTTEEESLNLVGTYSISSIKNEYVSDSQNVSIVMSMPTSSSFREAGTISYTYGDTTSTQEMDVTVTKTTSGYTFTWTKYTIDGVDATTEQKSTMESTFDDDTWADMTEMFFMTITTKEDLTWTDNGDPASSGTYTVDETNSKVTIKTLVSEGTTLDEPEEMECTYSNYGKNLVVVEDNSSDSYVSKTTITLVRQ